MAELTDSQYERILLKLNSAEIINKAIIPELADHLGCIIENDWAGQNFEKALNDALQIVCPDGAAEIDQQITFYTKPQTPTIMKKSFYAALFAALFLISNGLMFKFFHWEGAGQILCTGFFILGFMAMPLMAAQMLINFRTLTSTDKAQQLSAIAASLLVSLGVIFKGMHWPGANITLLVGMAWLNLVFIPVFFYRLYLKATV